VSGTAFEIWRERDTGERYLVGCRFGAAYVVLGVLGPTEDPREALERHAARRYTDAALPRMRRHPERFQREYELNRDGRAVLRGQSNERDG
jgi:hypothetical protein